MKAILILLFNFLPFFFVTTYAQKGQPSFGKIDKEDLLLTDCAFDKGAIALKLIDWGNLYYERGTAGFSFFKTVYEQRVRIKILKEKGLNYANVTIPYYSNNNDEKIVKVDAYTYNLDATGNVKKTEVSKASIYNKKINNLYSELIIAFPEAKVGSVIEYKYKMERETMGHIKDWYFQDKIPTKFSEYEIKIPQILNFNIQSSIVDSIDAKEEVQSVNLSMNEGVYQTQIIKKNFIMRNLLGVRNEPFMGAAKDYQQRLEFQLAKIDYGNGDVKDVRVRWDDVVNDLVTDEDFGKQLEKIIPETNTFLTTAKSIGDKKKRLAYVLDYLKTNISWNGRESIYVQDGIAKTWKNNTGNTADVNLLLVKLLNDVGIKSDPILLSTRDNGLLNTYFPYINQFNIVMAYVNLEGKNYVLDATDKYSNYNLTPEKIANTQGFVIEKPKGKWINIVEISNKYKVQTAISGNIDNNGILKGECIVNSSGYSRKQRLQNWVNDKPNFKQKYFSTIENKIEITDFKINNIDSSNLPLEQKISFNYPLNNSGDYKYFTTNFFTDLDKNIFIQDERFADIDFGFLQDYIIYGNFTLSNSFQFEELPKNLSLVMPDNSIVFNRFCTAEDNTLNLRITIEFKKTFYTVEMYPELKEFFKKMYEGINEQIVIKKK